MFYLRLKRKKKKLTLHFFFLIEHVWRRYERYFLIIVLWIDTYKWRTQEFPEDATDYRQYVGSPTDLSLNSDIACSMSMTLSGNRVSFAVSVSDSRQRTRLTSSRRHGRDYNTSHQNPFPCHKCGRSYRNKGSLKRHLHDECGKPPQYICSICEKGFKQKANFQRHNATIHGHLFAMRPWIAIQLYDVYDKNKNDNPNSAALSHEDQQTPNVLFKTPLAMTQWQTIHTSLSYLAPNEIEKFENKRTSIKYTR